ncbi:hypothetical protein KIH31_15695 [Paenarthrobacter sp. DKR-5]|uniref:hypothetical protein n=1 Tax=Paenarthrobacter sp. DKR-5 TaxID=2835535 RepID=UPI001BDC51AD|nr:hypothetical protein [Paenarthrobacter sp. DKR-5]MBT1004030.1 hypothetical protein [Paenarthrobacter sp. DKR-5]
MSALRLIAASSTGARLSAVVASLPAVNPSIQVVGGIGIHATTAADIGEPTASVDFTRAEEDLLH